MKTYPRLPDRGEFAFQMSVAPHRSSGAAMHDPRGFFGLHLGKTMPFGTVRDAEGHMYSSRDRGEGCPKLRELVFVVPDN